MANELQYYANPDTDSGESVTAKVYDSAGSQVGGTVSCSEVGTLAIYHGNMPSALADVYTVRFFESNVFVAQGTIEWDGSKEVTNLSVQSAIGALNNFDPSTDTVARVTRVDTTTTNTDMRGTDNVSSISESDIHSALTSYSGKDQYQADLSSVLSRAESNAHYQALITEHSDTQAAIMALNDFDPANDIIGRVTLVDTTTTNTDRVDISNLQTSSKADAQYLSLIDEHSDTQSAIGALNDFNPASDTVAHVTLVDTTTTNSDMRGTDGASTVEPDNATIAAIAADTADLQANQGDWLTATGFSVHSAADVWSAATRSLTNTAGITTSDMQAIATAVESAILDENDGNQILNAIVGAIGNQNVDEIALVAAIRSDLERSSGKLDNAATAAQLAAQTDALSAEQTTTRSAIASLNDFDPANDSVAHVTLVDTTTTNTDMRGTDGAATTTRVETLVDILVDDHTVTQTAIAELNDLSAAEFRAVIIEGLVSHRTLTDTDLNNAHTELENYIDDNAGLTASQDTTLERLLDLAESDETYDKQSGKARKLLRGTDVVLLEKDVVGSTCTDSVSIAE